MNMDVASKGGNGGSDGGAEAWPSLPRTAAAPESAQRHNTSVVPHPVRECAEVDAPRSLA